jgi:hypothetical protein
MKSPATSADAAHVAAPQPPPVDPIHEPDHAFPYRALLGVLLWFCRRSYPQIRAAVTLLATFASAPTRYHVRSLKRVLKYVHTHTRDAIYFARDPEFDPLKLQLYGFTDADWAADRTTRRSMSGYFIYLNHNLISSGCKYHPTQCLSTMEAEYMGETFLSKSLLFTTNLLSELDPYFKVELPVQMFGDNAAALKFVEERTVNDRIKHIDLRHHFLHGLVERGLISMNFVCTADNIADLLTKPLSVVAHTRFATYVTGAIQRNITILRNKLTRLNEPRHRNL